MADLSTDIRTLKGIGEKKALAFQKLGIATLEDLLHYYPRRYEDRSNFRPIAEVLDGETVCIRAVVAAEPRLTRIRRGMDLVKLRAADESGIVDITYFNQSFMKDQLHCGEEYNFYGRVEVSGTHRSMANPVFETAAQQGKTTGRIVPVYRLCAGVNQRTVSDSIRQTLRICGDDIPELLLEDVLHSAELCSARFAYENIHFPSDEKALEMARKRLVFEELFILSCGLSTMRASRTRAEGVRLQGPDIQAFWDLLPFSPTNAQRRAVQDALADLASGFAMSRLVQGDVGSGKTLVAAALIWYTVQCGHQCAFMAPTEILAEQHARNLQELLAPCGVRVDLLTGSTKAKARREVQERLACGMTDVLVGTHVLFSEDIVYHSLGLAVTDEQHRFGVAQRSALIGKGSRPHVLVMSATPIPRTLALILYGDLDVSIIDELPPGRQKVDTFTVDESYRTRLNGFIRRQVEEGRQVFVVCPMVEENEELVKPLKPAEEHAKALAAEFPDLRVLCIHGKMKPAQKENIMASFVSHEADILVSTTVIEVGVDVPNAALMIIENAERFGLSQLHQLRGRVGRGKHKSYCILVSDADNPESLARLKIMCSTNDGFRISEEDLRLRGPGDFFGNRQSGLPETHIADLGADVSLLELAKEQAILTLAKDPALEAPQNRLLRKQVDRLLQAGADSFN